MDAKAVAPSASRQLEAIAGVGSRLDDMGVDHWLFGGWAVDFWVGGLTREHGDIDLAAWLADRAAIHDALIAQGWDPAPVEDEVIAASYEKGGCLVEFTFVVPDDQGRCLIPFEGGPAVWSPKPFGDQRRTLLGVTARTVPLARLVKDKGTPREDPQDAAKDIADLRALSSL